MVRGTLFVLSSLSVLFIVGNSLTYPQAERTNKTLFLSRLLFYIILPLSVMADSALRACHGTEYFCVTGSVSRNSSMTTAVRRNFIAVSVLLCGLGAIFLLCRQADGLVGFWYDSYAEVPPAIKVLSFVSIVLTYTHYYLDRRLFRFRNAANREHVLPLLNN